MPRGKRKHRQDIGTRAIPQTVNKQDTVSGLDAWRTIRRLGAGSHGAVYEVESRAKPGKRVALKILNHLLQDERAKSRFKQEADAARLVRHPNVVEVFDADVTEDGKCYLLMELVVGRRLDQLDLPLPIHQALAIGADVAAALGAAHARGVVHRDVKPQNILLSRESTGTERVKLLDFGIAKLLDPEQSSLNTATGERLGTPAYMAPEQWRCVREIDGRADVYALGITLYELLMGLQPFQASSDYEWGQVHDKQELPQRDSFLNLPSEVQTLILKMVEKDREKRPQQMSQLAVELRKLSETLYVPPLRAAPPHRYATTGLLLLALVYLTSEDRVQVRSTANWLPTSLSTLSKQGVLSTRSTEASHRAIQGRNEDPTADRPALGIKAEVSKRLTLPMLDLSESPEPMRARDHQQTNWFSVWPGFSNGHVSTPQRGIRAVGRQSDDLVEVRLFWKMSPPTQPVSLRISSIGRVLLPVDVSPVSPVDSGWFRYERDALLFDRSQLGDSQDQLLLEARDQFGCLLAAGRTVISTLHSSSSHYLPLELPSRAEFLQLVLEHRRLPEETAAHPGFLLVRDQDQHPLVECGERCSCWIPKGAELSFSGLGSQDAPFAKWSTSSCGELNPCIVTESDLWTSKESTIVGTFLSWQEGADKWEVLRPFPVELTTSQRSYYHRRKHAGKPSEFANPTQLRSVSSMRAQSFWMAGRGGVLARWDGELRAFQRLQVGAHDNSAPLLDSANYAHLVGRTSDFYSVAQASTGQAVAVGHKEFSYWFAKPTAFMFDGQSWTETTLASAPAGREAPADLDSLKTLNSVWSSSAGNTVIAAGLEGGMIHSGLGVLKNPDKYVRSLWSVSGSQAGVILLVGSSKQPGLGPVVMTTDSSGIMQLHGDLRQPSGEVLPDNTMRTGWVSPDGKDVWFAGLNDRVFQYRRDEAGQLTPTTVCPRGAQTHRVLSMWGTDRNNVWVASRNEVLHCDGTNPWTIRHTAPPGVELTGIAGDPTGEIWVVGFYKAPDQNPGPTGPNDFAYVARLRPENRPRVGESLFPQDEVVSEQSADHPDRSVD